MLPEDVVLVAGTDKGWNGEPNLCDESVALRLERDRRGRIVSHWVPTWFPPLTQVSRPKGSVLVAGRNRHTGARPRESRRTARTRGSRSPPDDPSPSPHHELGRLDAASWRLWAHVARREGKSRAALA